MWRSALFLLLLAAAAQAQVVDDSRMMDVVNLSGDWRFHKGDDPQWGRPDFDDSHWQLISTVKDWREQGLSGYSGMFWYRLHVKVPTDLARLKQPLGLLIADGFTSYEVFVNGLKIGKFGQFGSNESALLPRPQHFGIPEWIAPDGSLSIAMRFWMWPVSANFNSGGPSGKRGVLLGPERAIETEYLAGLRDTYLRWVPNLLLLSFATAVAIGLLLLYRLNPRNREYLWLALALTAIWIANPATHALRSFAPIPIVVGDTLALFLGSLGAMLLIQFIVGFVGLRKIRLIRAYQFSQLFFVVLVLFYSRLGIPVPAINAFIILWSTPITFGIPLLLSIHYRRGNKEAGLLFISLFLYLLNDALSGIGWLLYQLGYPAIQQKLIIPDLPIGPVDVSFDILASLFFVISVCAVVFYRYSNTERERMRAVSELEAARSVQSLMIPRVAPLTPGFHVESVYVPAQEVGGDFFQVMSFGDGSVLAVVGDVSGKGMKAAMVVSMLVGVLRDVAQDLHGPAYILQRLNQSLVRGGHDGFVTCLVLSVGSDGTVVAANAGHLSPYRNGLELDVDAGLPLGIVDGLEYSETIHRVDPGDRLWMISDGIVEARDAKGGLFGFERVARQLGNSKTVQDAIPTREFVPDDDMTVVVLQRDV